MTHDRVQAVEDLVSLRIPVLDAREALRRFPWDSDGLVTLTAADIADVLRRYLNGSLSASEVCLWAEAVEGRDDIDLAADHEAVITATIFRLATPELFESLSERSAQALIDQLG